MRLTSKHALRKCVYGLHTCCWCVFSFFFLKFYFYKNYFKVNKTQNLVTFCKNTYKNAFLSDKKNHISVPVRFWAWPYFSACEILDILFLKADNKGKRIPVCLSKMDTRNGFGLRLIDYKSPLLVIPSQAQFYLIQAFQNKYKLRKSSCPNYKTQVERFSCTTQPQNQALLSCVQLSSDSPVRTLLTLNTHTQTCMYLKFVYS